MEATQRSLYAPPRYDLFASRRPKDIGLPFIPTTPRASSARRLDGARFSVYVIPRHVFGTKTSVQLDLDQPNFTFEDGVRYFGPMRFFTAKGWLPHGKGFCYLSEGQIFRGYFEQGERQGWGMLTSGEDTIAYQGYYRNNMRHGYGERTFCQYGLTFTYKGQFRDDKFHGPGEMFCSDGRSFAGSFTDGYSNPGGIESFPDGRKYSGEYMSEEEGEAVMSGWGTMWFPNGDRYEGEFADNEITGRGRYYNRDKQIFSPKACEDGIPRSGLSIIPIYLINNRYDK